MVNNNSGNLLRSNFRWVVTALLFFSTTIVYFDRMILGILAPVLGDEMGWTEQQYGYIVFSWQLAYAVGTLSMGYLIDKYGTRKGFSLAVLIWAFSSLFHSIARSWIGFSLVRMGLGLGQAANFPASIKTISEWFPARERALATGLFNGGANVGQILAPLVIPIIILVFVSWKYVFVFSFILSCIWLLFWLVFFNEPVKNKYVNKLELEYIQENEIVANEIKVPYRKLVLLRQTWVVVLGKLFADPVWYFYLFWSAKFLNGKFNINLTELALPLIVIYTFGYLGGIGGGAVSSWLLKRGKSVNFSRKTTMLGSAFLVIPVMLVPLNNSLFISVGILAIAAAAHNSWSANIFTVASDLFPKKMVGSVIGFSTTISTLASMGTSLLIGFILNVSGTEGYFFPFFIASFIYMIGIGVVHFLSPKFKPFIV